MSRIDKNTNILSGLTSVISTRSFSNGVKGVSIGLLALLIVSTIILAYVPPVSRDALTHHLAVPKLYLKHGGIYEIPSIAFSYYPMNLDLLYTLSLYFQNDIAPKLIHYIFALLSAGLIFNYLKKRIGTDWGFFGAIFFLSLPIIVKLSITVYVDLGLIFFSTVAIIYLLEWIENCFQIKFLIISAIGCGLALGTKYNGLIVLFLLTVFTPFAFISHCKRNSCAKNSTNKPNLIKTQLKAVGYGAIFFMIALLVFSPWMIRNYVWKANPLYPLYDNVFNRPMPAPPATRNHHQALEPAADLQQPSQVKSARWGPFAIRKVIYGESWWEIALIPVRIFFQGQDDNPRYFDGKLNPFLLFLPFFTLVRWNKNPASLQLEQRIFISFVILFMLYAFSTTSIRIRYVAPIISPLVILATFGLREIARMVTRCKRLQPSRLGSGFLIFLIAIVLALNASYIIKQFHYVHPFSYLSGRVSRDAYITKYRPEYPVYQYANRQLPDNVKILGLFLGNRRYYSEKELIFGVNRFEKIVGHSNSGKKMLTELKEKGFTNLIVRFDLFNQWANRQFDNSKKEMLELFFDEQTKPIFSANGYGLFELIDNRFYTQAGGY